MMMMMTAMTIVFDERCEKKFGIEHSRTDMTEMKQTSSSKGKLQQNFTIPIHSDEMR